MDKLTPLSRMLVDRMAGEHNWAELGPVAFREYLVANRQPPTGEDNIVAQDVDADGVPVRLYRPAEREDDLPVLLFMHGGGFVSGTVNNYDRLCHRIARKAGCAVASVEYRLAPEHPYPAAVEDAIAALGWVAREGGKYGIDTSRIAIGGDSAGGTLSIVASLNARDRGGPAIRHMMLIYPGLDLASETESKREFGRGGYMLDEAFSAMCIGAYTPDPARRAEPNASPLRAESVAGLPSATIIVPECDPLRDDILAFSARLEAAGVPVDTKVYPGVFHGFVSTFGILPEADDALDRATAGLKAALAPAA
ncbi:alpha/beta hydrolase [Sphingomonas crocodyli]|uniref:Alpha/beta hydrolase n=1 Tax=Sphingomonas crocodyli TaxID=1979270 RepID=A0A437MBQ0_9SPHN|nr:alpha/beta hydrolase [Sphingomonas crocodyli]RVT95058.1 alpha/beta hydrolase [Sphingomonas crocodyli]